MSNSYKYTIIFFLISILSYGNPSLAFAQKKTSWTDWQTLFDDGRVKVEIQFKLREGECFNGGRNSKYRYKVTGNLYSYNKYVYWKMKYKGCNDRVIVANNSIAIGGSDAVNGLVESIDYVFLLKSMIKKFYEVSTGKQQNNISNNNYNNNNVNTPNNNSVVNNTPSYDPNKYISKRAKRKNYKSDLRSYRKTIPYKYCLRVGWGMFSENMQSSLLNSSYSSAGMFDASYSKMLSLGLFRRFAISPSFTRKGKDISNVSLFGLFADAGYIGGINFVHTEIGFHINEIYRLSAGVMNYGNINDYIYVINNYKYVNYFYYSLTFGYTLKIRKIRFNMNYVTLLDKDLSNFLYNVQFSVSYNLNFYRKVPAWKKRQLKKINGL